jgi:GNAT superfamily N-acetyltransferase
MEKRIFTLNDPADLERAFPVIKELRPHLNFSDYKEILDQASKSDGYRIVAVETQGQIVALMGFRILFDFVRGKHLYIDDLVSTESVRSKGLGAELLRYAEGFALESGCKTLRLCTGVENERGVNFYERNGWTKRAFAYTKKIT